MATQVAILLHFACSDPQEIHSMFIFNDEESSDMISSSENSRTTSSQGRTLSLQDICPGKGIIVQMSQWKNGSLTWKLRPLNVSVVKKGTISCGMKLCLVWHVCVKKCMLREANLPLAKAEEYIRVANISKAQLAAMSHEASQCPQEVEAVHSLRGQQEPSKRQSKSTHGKT